MAKNKARYYVFRDESSDNPYGAPLRVDPKGITDLSRRYSFDSAKLNSFRFYRAYIPIAEGIEQTFELAVGRGNNLVRGYSASDGLSLSFAEISKDQAVNLKEDYERTSGFWRKPSLEEGLDPGDAMMCLICPNRDLRVMSLKSLRVLRRGKQK